MPYALAEMIMAVIVVLGISVVLLSFFIALRFKKNAKIIALALVTSFWLGLFHYYVVVPRNKDRAENSWRTGASSLCMSETAALPKEFPVNSIQIDAAILRNEDILYLLSNRIIKFVEIRITSTDYRTKPFIATGSSSSEYWDANTNEGAYARIELGLRTEPGCAKLNVDRTELYMPPLLPNSCVKITYTENPTSQYALMLKPEADRKNNKYGKWVFFDKQAGNSLAELTTSDTYREFSSGSVNPNQPYFNKNDCRIPAMMIAQRIVASDTTNENFPQVLSEKEVVAQKDLVDIDLSDESIPSISAQEHIARFSNSEYKQLFNPELTQEAWIAAIETAKITGWGSYGALLVDWRTRRILRFEDHDFKMKSHIGKWKIFALTNGFIAATDSLGYTDRYLVRYSNDGTISWTAHIRAPQSQLGICERFSPRAIFIDKKHLVIADSCKEVSPSEAVEPDKVYEGVFWSVPIEALPGTI